jgi:long-chain fatty acid transport protein
MKRFAFGSACALVVALQVDPVQANGNSLPRAAAESLGIADANVALITGPSATFINPANLLADDGHTRWSAGALIGTARAHYTRPAPAAGAAAGDYESERSYPVVPYAAFSGAVSESVAWGFAIDAPHGLGTEWPDQTWNVTPAGDLYRESELTVVRVGPALAWSPTSQLSLGARLFAQSVEATETSDVASVEGDGTDSGFQVGARYRTPRLILAAAYTSRTNTNLEGSFTALGTTQAASADFLLPDRLQAGVAWQLAPEVWWEFDADWFGWSYVDELAIRDSAGTALNTAARHNRDTTTLRTGVRWRKAPDLTLQAGIGYDPTPIPDIDVNPTGSIIRKTRLALGALWTLDDDLRLDLAYQYVHGHARVVGESGLDDLPGGDTGVYEGTYASDSHIWAIGLTGRF